MSFFITGTDTGVGKTLVTAGLAAVLVAQGKRVCVVKPVQTGSLLKHSAQTLRAALESNVLADDLVEVLKLTGQPENLDTFCSYCFKIPAAPLVADTEGVIDPRRLVEDVRKLQQQYDVVLVEGAGGIRVPITHHYDMADLIKELGLPTIVVTRPDLGTINHTLLTVDVLKARQIPVHGVVVSRYPQHTRDEAVLKLEGVLKRWLNVPLLGIIPDMTLQAGSLRQGSLVLKHFEQILAPTPVGV